MTILEAISERHSVRSYKDKPLDDNIAKELQDEITVCNKESGLNIQLVTGEKNAFDGFMAHYGISAVCRITLPLLAKRVLTLMKKSVITASVLH